jgi:KipI family sensor histidine kinase inhibitor
VRIHPVGTDALLVEVDDPRQAAALFVQARARRVAVDVVPALRTVLLDGVDDPHRLAAEIPTWPLTAETTARQGRLVEVPTRYDGEDLGFVARCWDMTVTEVVATHTGTEFVVAFCGFAPGFPYCVGLPAALAVPRLPSPRARVPAGSVGLADDLTGIYPTASPGGWRLLGRTALALWDPGRAEPATLPPGTRVRFVAV